MSREKVSEWFEVWVEVPGYTPCRLRRYGAYDDFRIHPDAFATRKEAEDECKMAGKYARIVRVIRYRKK